MTVWEDASLPHQIRIDADMQRGWLYVSCNCMQDADGRFIPLIEPGAAFDLGKARAAYRAHLEEVGGP